MRDDLRISLVINTAAGDARVSQRKWRWEHRRAGYGARASILRDEILPAVIDAGYDEIIVAGIWEPGEGYMYIEVPPRYRDRRDALDQRELGFRYSTGDVIVFCHDDHLPADDTPQRIRAMADQPWDILVTERHHGQTGEALNNGSPEFADDGRAPEYVEHGYMGSHAPIMRRWVSAEVPWTSVDTEYWDLPMTDLWRAAGAEIVFTSDLVHYDLEALEDER